ncbi:MAG: nucleoside 2-deoxyribosyltransferase [Nanoarchaeota archaeon]
MEKKAKKVYIAGKIGTENEKEILEKIDKLCKGLGFLTFLPHRDVGIAHSIKDVNRIFEGDIKIGFRDVRLVVAVLDGLHIGAGTAWELGYAYANGIPAIGIKTDESPEESLEQLSAILISSMPIVNSLEELKSKLEEFKNKISP